MKPHPQRILIDFAALLLVFLFLILARFKMQTYMNTIQEFYPQIEILSQGTPSVFQIGSLVQNLSPVVDKYLFFLYLTPVIIALLFILSQGINWQLNFNKKINKKYLIDFTIISLPFLLVTGFLGVKLFSRLADVLYSLLNGYLYVDYILIIYLVLVLVVSYFYIISIASLKKLDNVKEGLLVALKRFYPLFFIYLPFVIINLALIFVIFLNFIFVISENYSFGKGLVSLVIIFLFLFITDKYRNYFSRLFFSKK